MSPVNLLTQSVCSECDAIDRALSMQAIMEIFVQSNVDVDSQDNLDTGRAELPAGSDMLFVAEFIYPEFIEALARCADAKITGKAPLAEKLENFLQNNIFPTARSC